MAATELIARFYAAVAPVINPRHSPTEEWAFK
jgi:hypothetical protein